MAGRKPKPTALKVLEGNPGKRPLNDREPQPEVDIPDVPDHLDDEAVREWNRIAPLLRDIGVLTHIDRAALAAYCQSWSRWVDAEDRVRKHGAIVKSPNGFPVQSPFLNVANRAMKQMKEFLVEFGMTPSSRSRVVVSETAAQKDPAERYFSVG